MKKLFLSSMIFMISLSPSLQAKTCLKEYKVRIDKMESYYSGTTGGDLLYFNLVGGGSGYLASGATLVMLDLIVAIVTSASPGIIPIGAIASGVGLAIPVAVTTAYAADTIVDAPFVKMMRIIERANIEAGLVSDEVLRTDFIQEKPVDGVTKEEIRQQRNFNRYAHKHNETLVKLNKKISSRVNKRKNAFDDLISELEKTTGKVVQREEVARLVVEADTQEKLCNSEIRLAEEDLELRTDFIRVTGTTATERMRQRSHNRQIERHNNRITKMIEEKDLAKLSHLVNYLASQLP